MIERIKCSGMSQHLRTCCLKVKPSCSVSNPYSGGACMHATVGSFMLQRSDVAQQQCTTGWHWQVGIAGLYATGADGSIGAGRASRSSLLTWLSLASAWAISVLQLQTGAADLAQACVYVSPFMYLTPTNMLNLHHQIITTCFERLCIHTSVCYTPIYTTKL